MNKTIGERIEQLIQKFADGNRSAFGLKVGLSEARVRSYINGTQPSADALSKLVKSFDIDAQWLLTGDGEMLRKVPSVASFDCSIHQTQPKVKPIGEFKVAEKEIEQQRIPLYELEATAGLFTQGDISQYIIDYISIPNAPRCDGAIVARGDSMAPIIKSGDILLYKEHDVQDIMFGHIYIVDFELADDSMVVVKYIHKCEEDPKRIRLVSENPRYDPMDIPLEQVRHVAMVKLSVCFHTLT